jgi:RHS repeat-associated protein
MRVTDNSNKDRGFKYPTGGTTGDTYTYDDNGNLTSDKNKGITKISYNLFNMPIKIEFGANRKIEFLYDPSGQKLRKTVTENNVILDERYYIEGVELNKDGQGDFVRHTEGGLRRGTDGVWRQEFVLRDHLGNTRTTYSDLDGNGTINPHTEMSQINHYYSFGLNMEANWNGAQGTNKNQYNGKEWNDDFGLGWNDYGARFYDPSVSRWTTIDPLAVFYRTTSPYCYVENNPIGFMDIEGCYKFPARYHSKYKTLTAYLQNNIWNDLSRSPLILAGLLKYSGGNLTREAVEAAATWGSGPTIEIDDKPGGLPGNGFYDKASNTIYISTALANQLENATEGTRLAALTGLYKTVLHETVHFGDYLDGRRQDGGEPGDDFDNDLYFGEYVFYDGEYHRRTHATISTNGIATIENAQNWYSWALKTKMDFEMRQLIPTFPDTPSRHTPPPVAPLPLPTPKPTPLPRA